MKKNASFQFSFDSSFEAALIAKSLSPEIQQKIPKTTVKITLSNIGEYLITGRVHPAEPDQKDMTKDEAKRLLAISVPGEETDMLAAKAKQYGTYIAAQALENDPDWPDLFFNTGFIINPQGKIIL